MSFRQTAFFSNVLEVHDFFSLNVVHAIVTIESKNVALIVYFRERQSFRCCWHLTKSHHANSTQPVRTYFKMADVAPEIISFRISETGAQWNTFEHLFYRGVVYKFKYPVQFFQFFQFSKFFNFSLIHYVELTEKNLFCRKTSARFVQVCH